MATPWWYTASMWTMRDSLFGGWKISALYLVCAPHRSTRRSGSGSPRAVRDHVPGPRQYETFQRLSAILLLTYALHNADCHSKNIALLYTSHTDVHLSPAYDFLTTSVYAGYRQNPPGISFLGKKTWAPGKNLSKFIAGHIRYTLARAIGHVGAHQ